MTRCPGESGAVLLWAQIQDVLELPVSAATSSHRIPDETICRPRGSGGGGTFRSPTWCAYDCEGMPRPVEIELPAGMPACSGEWFGQVPSGEVVPFLSHTTL